VCPQVPALLGKTPDEYSSSKMSYDLRRLRPNGLIARIPHTHRYNVTSYGLHVALLCTKLFQRILSPTGLPCSRTPTRSHGHCARPSSQSKPRSRESAKMPTSGLSHQTRLAVTNSRIEEV
jgi:hypothetical protein